MLSIFYFNNVSTKNGKPFTTSAQIIFWKGNKGKCTRERNSCNNFFIFCTILLLKRYYTTTTLKRGGAGGKYIFKSRSQEKQKNNCFTTRGWYTLLSRNALFCDLAQLYYLNFSNSSTMHNHYITETADSKLIRISFTRRIELNSHMPTRHS